MTKEKGGMPFKDGEEFVFDDLYEYDNLDYMDNGVEIFENGVTWHLCFAQNIGKDHSTKSRPKYFIWFAWYPDHTIDIIRFYPDRAEYLTGYNETRRFYKDELKWVIEKLNSAAGWDIYGESAEDYRYETGNNWERGIYFYNEENRAFDRPEEIFTMPDYSLLETED